MADDDDLVALKHSSARVEQRDLYAVMQILKARHQDTASWLAVTLVTLGSLQLIGLAIIILAAWPQALAHIIQLVGGDDVQGASGAVRGFSGGWAHLPIAAVVGRSIPHPLRRRETIPEGFGGDPRV